MARQQVAESCLSYLQMELMRLALGPDPDKASTSQLQNASRIVESIGFSVGVRLAERYTKDRPRFADTLEIIKFICKDFWVEVFRKQIDKLQTNNRVSGKGREGGRAFGPEGAQPARTLFPSTPAPSAHASQGVYMLQDNSHPILTRCSPSADRVASATQLAAVYAKFPAGLIRGALSGLGVLASVSSEVSEVPKCQFTIKIQPAEKT